MQYAKPSTPPRQGTAELFFDINNYGYPTVYYPDGTTQPLVADIMIDGETLVIGTRINETLNRFCSDTKIANGFVPGTYESSTLAVNGNMALIINGNRTWYCNGHKYTKSTSDTADDITTGVLNYIYYDEDVLSSTTNIDEVNGPLVATYLPGYFIGDERHTTSYDFYKDKADNKNIKGRYINGFDITVSGNTLSGNIAIASGSILCNDFIHSLTPDRFRCIGIDNIGTAINSVGNSIAFLDYSTTYVCYFNNGTWTPLSGANLTSYTIMASNETGNTLLSINDNISASSLIDVINNPKVIIPSFLRYATPLYRIVLDKDGNIAAVIDLRYISKPDNCKSISSEISNKINCQYTRNDTASRYDIINYMGASGNNTTTVAITADGSASSGLFVSGEVDALMPMASITNDGAGTSLEVSNTDGGLAFKADGRTALGIETISAGATIVPVGNKPIIKVTSDSSSQDNLITMPTGVAGQILTIINLDEDPITSNGNVYIPSGEAQQYIYVDSTVGWMPLGYGQVVSTVVQS